MRRTSTCSPLAEWHSNSEGSYRLCEAHMQEGGVMDWRPRGGRQGLQQLGQTAGGSSEHTWPLKSLPQMDTCTHGSKWLHASDSTGYMSVLELVLLINYSTAWKQNWPNVDSRQVECCHTCPELAVCSVLMSLMASWPEGQALFSPPVGHTAGQTGTHWETIWNFDVFLAWFVYSVMKDTMWRVWLVQAGPEISHVFIYCQFTFSSIPTSITQRSRKTDPWLYQRW